MIFSLLVIPDLDSDPIKSGIHNTPNLNELNGKSLGIGIDPTLFLFFLCRGRWIPSESTNSCPRWLGVVANGPSPPLPGGKSIKIGILG